ncbi:ATP-binding protein (plasmid) [Halorientalis pallida]|uniref:ATP-binding protein n=1 Tax=Halorientalis pallida TaxID=2479928 RepID=UPI003C6FA2A4
MRLQEATLDRYGPISGWEPPCQDGLTVVSGPNEAGKTLYLEGLVQLLSTDVGDILDPPPRVDNEPVGRVVVEYDGDRIECGNGQSICDVTLIEPQHLQSIFVVRDTDLHLPSNQQYYTSLIETLGDIHTSEIDAIKAELKERGRLTKKTLNVSSNQQYDDAGDVRDGAQKLADEIREFVEEIEDKGLDELESRRLQKKREFQEAQEELATQQKAELASEYDRLASELETYRTTSEQLEKLSAFDSTTLDELQELKENLDRNRDRTDNLTDDIEDTEAELERREDELVDAQERRDRLARRENAVSDADTALDRYRERERDASGAERNRALAKPIAVAGLLSAGVASLSGAIFSAPAAIALGALLFVAGAVSGYVAYRANEQVASLDAEREEVLQTARDAGLSVESIEDVAPAIESYRDDLEAAKKQVTRAEAALDTAQEELEEARDEKAELEDEIAKQETELDDRLDGVGVATVGEFAEKVDERVELENKRALAKRSLVDEFGDLNVESWRKKTTTWNRQLKGLVADVDLNGVDADTYDEDELARLEEEVAELGEKIAEMDAQLDEYHTQLDEFADRARNLGTQPFVGESVTLKARTKTGLEALAADLDRVVETIERDADFSRKALEVFERIEAQEEQKLATLFDPEGPASETFSRLTGGRYTEVAYDADDHGLTVEHADGRGFGPEVLSQGTTDQLYFATRVSLAQQLLGQEPGFLLLDDPFLAADSDRLQQGFESLLDLADDGWQILYLTAKEEVSQGMVQKHGLDHAEMAGTWNGK